MIRKKVVLIVDDDRGNAELLATLFEDVYDLRVAFNGKKAIRMLKKIQIDLVLLDIQMPDMDGYAVAEQILQDDQLKGIPIIFVTAQRDEASVVKGFNLGAVDFISKPFHREELSARVNTHLQLSDLKRYFQTMLDSLSSMVALTNGREMFYCNQAMLDYFQVENLNGFKARHICVCSTFVDDSRFFSFDLQTQEGTWFDEITQLDIYERIVSIYSIADNDNRIFRVNLKPMGDGLHLAEFIDISRDFHHQTVLLDKSHSDPLTQTYNRVFFNENIDLILSHSQMHNAFLGVGFMDLDHFKNINDTFGHDVGDEVLKALVVCFNRAMRKSDVLVRWGGEEFMLFFELVNESDLVDVLEKFRKLVEETEFEGVGTVTCSFGGSIYLQGELIHDTIKRADQALYESKRAGRNRVTVS